MATIGAKGRRLGLLVALIGFAPILPCQALLAGMFVAVQGNAAPNAGEWFEVVTATPRWLVLQNQKGQQFPVAAQATGMFLIRWPTSLDRITPQALVEATGIDLGSNEMRTDHVDVYEGTARGLVTPYFASQATGGMLNNNAYTQVNLQFNLFQPQFGVGAGPVIADAAGGWIHVVGPATTLNPLRLAIGGNINVAVYPMPAGMALFQVTPGAVDFLRPGDLVFAIPQGMTAKSVVLSQLIAYKSIPFDRFVR